MSSDADIFVDDLPPGFHFNPDDDEIVEFFLLPRVHRLPAPPCGDIIEDDAAASTQPWKLFDRHGLADDAKAFFYVRTNDVKGGARQDRRCDGGGTWTSQRRPSDKLRVGGGEEVEWSKHNLNLHMTKDSGSTGWVMHEYAIAERPSLKIVRISFTGHGQKRKRVPDGYHDCLAAESAPQRARVDASADGSSSATSCSGRTTTTFDQDFGVAQASEDQQPMQPLSSAEEVAEMFEELIDAQPNLEFQEPLPTMEHQVDQGSSVMHASADLEPLELLSDEDMSKIVDDLDQAMADGGPCLQFLEQVPTTTIMEQQVQNVMMPSLCGMQDIGSMASGTQDAVEWGGFCFC